MSKKLPPTDSHFASHLALVSHIREKKLGLVDSREWKEDWSECWVAFADLIAFASRSKRSDSVVLNNIVRFDRASTLVAAKLPRVRTHRFSDSTFAIAKSFHDALAFATALAHTCLAFNREYLERGSKPFFIHLIAPKITIAKGSVLQVPPSPAAKPQHEGIDPVDVIAGSAIVRAYELERASAGGLITTDLEGSEALQKMAVRGDNGRVTNAIRRWLPQLADKAAINAGEVLFHRIKVIDIPWLLLRPDQKEIDVLWGAKNTDGDAAIAAYLEMWDKSIREFYSPQNAAIPLDVAKHYQAATRHGIQSHHATKGDKKPRYQSVSELL